MAAATKPLLDYTPQNLRLTSKAIMHHLTPELLPIKYRELNLVKPMFGHCHTAAGCLYKIFGSQNVHMYRALDSKGIWHWWVQDRNGKIIDLTASQYSEKNAKRLYRRGLKSGMLGFKYRQNVKTVLRKVCRDLRVEPPSFCKA